MRTQDEVDSQSYQSRKGGGWTDFVAPFVALATAMFSSRRKGVLPVGSLSTKLSPYVLVLASSLHREPDITCAEECLSP